MMDSLKLPQIAALEDLKREREILARSDLRNGLTTETVDQLRQEWGFNELTEEKKNACLKFLGRQNIVAHNTHPHLLCLDCTQAISGALCPS